MRYRVHPTNFKPVFFCPVCSGMYSTTNEARACAVSTPKPTRAVGDLILLAPRYGWFDGDPAWVVKNTGEDFNGTPMLAFWYAVTAINTDDSHQVRYHLRSLALKSQGTGWTTEHGHHWEWSRAGEFKPPAVVVKQAQKFGEERFTNLI